MLRSEATSQRTIARLFAHTRIPSLARESFSFARTRIPSRASKDGNPFPHPVGSESHDHRAEKGFSAQHESLLLRSHENPFSCVQRRESFPTSRGIGIPPIVPRKDSRHSTVPRPLCREGISGTAPVQSQRDCVFPEHRRSFTHHYPARRGKPSSAVASLAPPWRAWLRPDTRDKPLRAGKRRILPGNRVLTVCSFRRPN